MTLTVTELPARPARDLNADEGAVEGGCAAVWRIEATAKCDAVQVYAYLPQAGPGSSNNGEHLEALAFDREGYQLVLGGYDDDALGQLVESGELPVHWRGALIPDRWDTAFGARNYRDSGLCWRLPGLESGDALDIHCAAAWGSNAALDAWFAVDTDPAAIYRTAR
ncbi:MAG: hypothetical protein AB7O74_14185 [Candidatus Nanopelagicales bacterium]